MFGYFMFKYLNLLLFLVFSHFYVGSMCLMRRLNLARSCASSLDWLPPKAKITLANLAKWKKFL